MSHVIFNVKIAHAQSKWLFGSHFDIYQVQTLSEKKFNWTFTISGLFGNKNCLFLKIVSLSHPLYTLYSASIILFTPCSCCDDYNGGLYEVAFVFASLSRQRTLWKLSYELTMDDATEDRVATLWRRNLPTTHARSTLQIFLYFP